MCLEIRKMREKRDITSDGLSKGEKIPPPYRKKIQGGGECLLLPPPFPP